MDIKQETEENQIPFFLGNKTNLKNMTTSIPGVTMMPVGADMNHFYMKRDLHFSGSHSSVVYLY